MPLVIPTREQAEATARNNSRLVRNDAAQLLGVLRHHGKDELSAEDLASARTLLAMIELDMIAIRAALDTLDSLKEA